MSSPLKEEAQNNECCQLCQSVDILSAYSVLPNNNTNNEIRVCETCQNHLNNAEKQDPSYWHFLTESMWSPIPAVQVLSWRLLDRFREASWAENALEIFYLEDDLLAWAKAGQIFDNLFVEVTRDSLENELQNGDTVILTRSLDVKGSSLNAKMGTVIKNIKLVQDNVDQIEGKIAGQSIIILTKYVKKQKG